MPFPIVATNLLSDLATLSASVVSAPMRRVRTNWMESDPRPERRSSVCRSVQLKVRRNGTEVPRV